LFLLRREVERCVLNFNFSHNDLLDDDPRGRGCLVANVIRECRSQSSTGTIRPRS
jgi:hypothetical protein